MRPSTRPEGRQAEGGPPSERRRTREGRPRQQLRTRHAVTVKPGTERNRSDASSHLLRGAPRDCHRAPLSGHSPRDRAGCALQKLSDAADLEASWRTHPAALRAWGAAPDREEPKTCCRRVPQDPGGRAVRGRDAFRTFLSRIRRTASEQPPKAVPVRTGAPGPAERAAPGPDPEERRAIGADLGYAAPGGLARLQSESAALSAPATVEEAAGCRVSRQRTRPLRPRKKRLLRMPAAARDEDDRLRDLFGRGPRATRRRAILRFVRRRERPRRRDAYRRAPPRPRRSSVAWASSLHSLRAADGAVSPAIHSSVRWRPHGFARDHRQRNPGTTLGSARRRRRKDGSTDREKGTRT